MSERQLVQVRWSGPYSVQEVIDDRHRAKGKGVYQLYGQHVVFGPGSLLYVGMTEGQTFGTRFTQHRRWLEYESDDVEVRLGVVEGAEDDEKLIADVEALTIWWHSPPYNSKNIWRYGGRRLHVQNWGSRGRLAAEYTSNWNETQIMPPDDEHE